MIMSFSFDYRASDSPLVETIWQTQSDDEGGEFMSSAGYQWEMVVTKQYGQTTLTIVGPETRAKLAPIPTDAEFFGILFKVGTFMPHLPVKSFVDDGLNLPEASNQSFWLNSATWQLPTFDNADTFIKRLVREGILTHDPMVQDVLDAHPLDVSPRTIQRRFLQATGITQGTLLQIQRAHYAKTLIEQGVSILDATYEAGYADQPHLTRSLKRFIGLTPTQIALTQAEIPSSLELAV